MRPRNQSRPRPPRRLVTAIEIELTGVSGVVLEDYGKGTLAPGVIRAAMRRFRAREVPVAVDPKTSLSPYRGASLLKPNLRKAETLWASRSATTRTSQRPPGGCGAGPVAQPWW